VSYIFASGYCVLWLQHSWLPTGLKCTSVCFIFKGTVNDSEYITSNDKMINEYYIGKDMEMVII
jgi:hypothetical protein